MAAAAGDGDEHLLSLFASALSHRRFGDQELRLLDAALSAGADVPSLLHTRSSARCLLRKAAAQAFSSVPDLGTTLSTADFFARAFALAGDVESCLAMRYEALLLRQAEYSDDLHLQVSNEEWLTFAKDSLDNGFYTIASKAFANALVRIDPNHPEYLDSTNSILKKDKINDISGLQNLAKSLSALRSGEHFRAMGILILMSWMGIWDPETMRVSLASSTAVSLGT
ncbi:Os12g0106100 [Oryza sativa Japonica Group]|nr:Os12g0106100 [Oryza sativa Japonica Group]|eukprot:NP_001065937.1 Os12g0106100 [Oryza sativa Japonica Group]